MNNLQKPIKKVHIPSKNNIHSSVYLSVLKNYKIWRKEFGHEECTVCKRWDDDEEENDIVLKDIPKRESKDH
jgi:hypothetical protein